jgi:hypothetical protein
VSPSSAPSWIPLKTPHLDRLARDGTDFHPFNVLNPVGSPSRAAAMTGMFGVAQYTIVIFSSDNGPKTTAPKSPQSSRDDDAGVAGYGYGYYSRIRSSGGLRGEKRRLFEGAGVFTFSCAGPATHPPE